LREAIHTLKYNGVQELAIPLGNLLRRRLRQYYHLRQAIAIPIPLHRSRECERGFNQAELLTRQLAQSRAIDVLVRYRRTKAQAKLDHETRLTNLARSFGINKNAHSRIVGQKVILVDDVATTGSTLDTAAAILKKSGVAEVWAVVLGRG
jgi:ComF family protein